MRIWANLELHMVPIEFKLMDIRQISLFDFFFFCFHCDVYVGETFITHFLSFLCHFLLSVLSGQIHDKTLQVLRQCWEEFWADFCECFAYGRSDFCFCFRGGLRTSFVHCDTKKWLQQHWVIWIADLANAILTRQAPTAQAFPGSGPTHFVHLAIQWTERNLVKWPPALVQWCVGHSSPNVQAWVCINDTAYC